MPIYTEKGWSPTGKTAQRYKPTNIINVESVVEKQKAKDIAKIQTNLNKPQFRSDVLNYVKANIGIEWDYMKKEDKETAVRLETDRRVKDAYPNQEIIYGVKNGVVGWYLDNKLVKPWEE